jgi:uncharacterized protein (DUF885 family)
VQLIEVIQLMINVAFRIFIGTLFLSMAGTLLPPGTACAATQTPAAASAALARVVGRYWKRESTRDQYAILMSGKPVASFPIGTLAEATADADEASVLLAELAKVPVSGLQGEDVLSQRMLQWILEQKRSAEQGYWFDFPISTYTNYELQGAGMVLAANHLATDEERQAYLSMLDSYAAWLVEAQHRLSEQAKRKIVLPKAVLPGATSYLRSLAAELPNWKTSVAQRTQSLDAAERTEFAAAVDRRIRDRLQPAFDSLFRYLETDYAKLAVDTVGVGHYPGGKDRYRYLVRYHTTLDLTPEEVMAYGQSHLRQINAEIDAIVAELNIPGGRRGLRQFSKTDPRFVAHTPDDVAARYRHYMKRIEPLVPKYFSVRPKAPYGVRRLDEAEEAGSTFGDYIPATPDHPVGEYRYNGSKLEERSLIGAVSLIYHELVPGHHFAISLQLENEALPVFRRYALQFGAFNEGWAEYAAGLSDEMGLLTDPYDRLGRLMMQAFLTARLVVDPGLNCFGWPLEKARQFLRENVYASDTEIATETLRYATAIPGQAVAYAIGQRSISQLREWAQKRAGAAFDVREFHREVIGHGSMPMSVLSTHIHAYYDKNYPQASTH